MEQDNKLHFQNKRDTENTILATEHNKQDKTILEALLIMQHGPKINRQTEDFNNRLKRN